MADDAAADFVRDPGKSLAKLIDALRDGVRSHCFRVK
jgi:hypothetical protein